MTAKFNVDNSIDEPSVIRNTQDNNFNNCDLTNINSNTLNKRAENDNEVKTEAYVDQFHRENERSRRDLGLDFYDESSDIVKNKQNNDPIDKKLTNSGSITVNRNPILDEEVSNKKYIDDQLDKKAIFRFNQTLENYLTVSVGKDIQNLTEYAKCQITEITEIEFPNVGG